MSKAEQDQTEPADSGTVKIRKTEQNQAEPADQNSVKTQKIVLYCVTVLSIFGEAASLVVLFTNQSVLEILIFQLPILIFFYRILCSFYPVRETEMNSFFDFLKAIFKK